MRGSKSGARGAAAASSSSSSAATAAEARGPGAGAPGGDAPSPEAAEAPPALAVIEVASIARGVVVADAVAKKAPVQVLQCHPTSPGKHVVVFAGGVAEVEESLAAGLAVAQATLVDRLLLPQVHASLPSLVAVATRTGWIPARAEPHDAVAVFETFTICAAILAADAAAKAAQITLTGELYDVEAAVAAGRDVLDAGLVVGTEIIAAPADELRHRLMW